MTTKKTVVRVTIVDEEYSIRSDESTDHTRAVAEYVDQAIRKVLSTGTVIESHKAAILAALQITDELFKARQSVERNAAAMRDLSGEIRRWLPTTKRRVGSDGSGAAG